MMISEAYQMASEFAGPVQTKDVSTYLNVAMTVALFIMGVVVAAIFMHLARRANGHILMVESGEV